VDIQLEEFQMVMKDKAQVLKWEEIINKDHIALQIMQQSIKATLCLLGVKEIGMHLELLTDQVNKMATQPLGQWLLWAINSCKIRFSLLTTEETTQISIMDLEDMKTSLKTRKCRQLKMLLLINMLLLWCQDKWQVDKAAIIETSWLIQMITLVNLIKISLMEICLNHLET
jgi:hypothetical protein